MKKWIFILIITLFTSLGCNRTSRIYIYATNKNQCISVITLQDIRYVVAGKHEHIPDSNFIKLNIKNIDPLGDALHICWKDDLGWDIVIHNSEVVELNLDTTFFNFSNTLPIDDRGVPTELKFREENCAIFDFYSMSLSPNKGAIVEFN